MNKKLKILFFISIYILFPSKTLKSEETSIKDPAKKSESLKENVSTEKQGTTDKETNKKITSPSSEDKK